ncbi:MAG: glycogen/starch/alpha-glucan phosphorylase, partial [Clostridia bacterium]|nr:glycogen/starch/alpha-glucan phosphorylase [Clostridia bacterium]
REAVGDENIFIFGMTAKDVENLWNNGYNSTAYYNNNARLQRVIESLKKGFNGESFENLSNYLLTASPVADPYMCMADFGAYQDVHAKADEVYSDVLRWQKMSLMNVAKSGRFSADRAIAEYAENIWNLRSTK